METILRLKVSTGKREFGIIGFNENGLLAIDCTQVPEKGTQQMKHLWAS